MLREPRFLAVLLFAALVSAGRCSHDNMVTNPAGAKPQITQIQPNPTHYVVRRLWLGR